MAYSSEISRTNPTCFLFVIDQSASMEERMAGGETKAKFLADVLNRTLVNLIIRCTRDDGVRNYFDVGVIAYGGTGVRNGFHGTLGNSIFNPLSMVEGNPLRIEERNKKISDGAGGTANELVKFPVWFDPVTSGGTPMNAGMTRAAQELVTWCDGHPQSYPPTLIHVTDGQSTDGDASNVAEAIKNIGTNDGQVLLCNLHVDTGEGHSLPFPHSEAQLPDQYSRLLFSMSSGLPDHLFGPAKEKGYPIESGARFFMYRADIGPIVDFFDIGTRASNLR